MRAQYDSTANAISIDLEVVDHWDGGVEVHERGHVALVGGSPVNIEVLYPDLGLEAPLHAIADRYGLDEKALLAAARAAVSAADRPVSIEVLAKQTA
ncbi:MAG TPA: hypothetical protein VEK39_06400 [Solirubrobacterales bacterium]|nr:hypothetical protein [Solirubrobacterales bacterium]